ncbi:dihydrodipicolinate synthase family protein [Thalassorhabdomicrobium marinisediminis]|uniref:Dihydrodipicolinate synthase family protein n=1 Tax=Thalassorhabdomicrobium marinisediminis TaxID=2170577 RepID=A0A2T7FZ14_9RHOB|nr:dihydrodipicolinate synthase family protein [Thalassorhabdomicrobium marinisediminis]PVA07399.1 dihydrodipicolinate synthase family protein [Thalassorhabdomicrobium marinisediminis]
MQGIIAAVPTPVDGDGTPQHAAFVEHCLYALAQGCDGLNILGSTGEANSFDTATRKDIMRWAAEALDPERLMVGTGTPSLAETCALTCHAGELGYAVALVLPPYYYAPVTDDGLFEWYAAVHRALGRRKIRIYLYNYPQMTGMTLSQDLIERLHRAFPDRFTGIKDSSGDLDYCRALAKALPEFRVFPSSETSIGEAADAGFAGCISATVNYSASLCAQLWATRDAPDAARLERVAKIRALIASQPLIPSIKHLMAQRTGDPVWDHVLPPFMALSAKQAAALAPLEPVRAVEMAG